MPAVVRKTNTRVNAGKSPTVDIDYLITGAASETAAVLALEAVISATYADLKLYEYGVGEADGAGCWPAYARYARGSILRSNQPKVAEPPAVGDSVWSEESVAEPERVYNSYQTIGAYYAGGIAASTTLHGVLNPTEDGVEGLDLLRPKSSFRWTTGISAAACTSAYRLGAKACVGKVNDATFAGRAAGEVLCVGVSFEQRNGGDWTGSFQFAEQRNFTGASFGPISGVAKDGWDYLNFIYETIVDTSAKRTVRTPIYATVERVYQRTSFAALTP